jgi:hypothetical protein
MTLSEERARFLDAVLKVAGVLGTLVAFCVGIDQYWEQREREFKRDLWTQQLTLYLEASRAASTLAYQSDSSVVSRAEIEKARSRFWQLYYGEMVVVEDTAVGRTMVEYGYCLRESELGTCSQEELIKRALALASACRLSVERSWREPLGPIAVRR